MSKALTKKNKHPVDLKLAEKFAEAERQGQTIDDFVQNFLNQFISQQTKKAYVGDLVTFFDFLKLGGVLIKHPSQLKGSHFQVYRDYLINEQYSSSTINRKLVAIRSFMKWALACQLIEFNPLDIVKLPKVQTENPTLAFDDHEVLAMLQAPNLDTKKGQMHKLVIFLLFSLGLRRSELVNIRVGDFYRDRGHYVLKIRGKGNKDRHLPLQTEILQAIKLYTDAMLTFGLIFEPDDFLIQSSPKGKNSKPMDGSTVYRIIERYARRCGINKKVGAHSCRATAISHLLDTQKTPIRDVAIFAGHSNITTTERYDKRRENLDKSAAYKVKYTD